MIYSNPSVEDRFNLLQPTPPEANFMLAGVQNVFESAGRKEFPCTISEYCRTQVFEFPGVSFQPTVEAPHMHLYSSASIRAHVTSNIVDYFENSTTSKQYGIDSSFRHVVAETDAKVKADRKDTPIFLVVEEVEKITPVTMANGECIILDEVIIRDGEKVPLVKGGRDGEKFLLAWHTRDGAWPQLPNNQLSTNLILAAVRAGQDTPAPIQRHMNEACLVTDTGRSVDMMRPTMSVAGVSIAKPMDTPELIQRVSEIADAITDMEKDITTPHLALLVNSMYSEERKDEPFRRLQYLQLWQAMADAGGKVLGFKGEIRKSKQVVAGKRRLKELYGYRNAIAHWWTDSIDDNYLADLRRTTNELIRRKYF